MWLAANVKQADELRDSVLDNSIGSAEGDGIQ